MDQVLDNLRQEKWERADILLVSDGEWEAPPELKRKVEKAREKGTRLRGVQVGNVGSSGLHSICDPVHVFSDWAEIAGWEGKPS